MANDQTCSIEMLTKVPCALYLIKHAGTKPCPQHMHLGSIAFDYGHTFIDSTIDGYSIVTRRVKFAGDRLL